MHRSRRAAAHAAAVLLVFPVWAGSQPDPRVVEMSRGVSQGYLEMMLLQLTGDRPFWIDGDAFRIDTRLSGTDGMDAAAQLLEQEFLRSGLEVRRHEYLGTHLEDIAFADSLHGWAVGDGGAILATRDGGECWTRQGSAAEQLHAVAALSGERAVAAGRTGTVLWTEDGGARWEWIETGSTRLRGVAFVDSLQGWMCGDDGGVFRTRDGGRQWTRQDTRVEERLNGVSFVDSLTGWVVGRRGYVLRTQNGGLDWTRLQIDGQPTLYAVEFLDSLTGWIAAEGGRVMNTADGGETWDSTAVDTAVTLYDLAFLDAERGWIVGGGGLIFQTTDGGVTWARSESGLAGELKAVTMTGGGWVAGHSALLALQDGVRWEDRQEAVEDRWVNVEATLPGAVDPEESYLLCGHFDSISEVAALRAPGADDNASGTALVVAAARALSGTRFEKTLTFVCFSGEENGLRGSADYAARFSKNGSPPLGVINADMVGYDPRSVGDVWISFEGDAPSRALAVVCSTLAVEYGLDLTPRVMDEVYGTSDHRSFADIGVPALMISHAEAAAYPYIHSVADRFDRLDVAFAREVTRLVVTAAATLAVPLEEPVDLADPAIRLVGTRPNPFSTGVGIRYEMSETDGGRVTLQLYDVRGRLLKTLVDRHHAPGIHEVWWDGQDGRGRQVGPGMCFIRVESGGRSSTAKLVRIE